MKPIISPHCRIRCPEHFHVGNHSIIDDFSYFSTQVEVGMFCHIAPNCTVAGGRDKKFTLGDFGGMSSGVRIYCESNDYLRDLITLKPPGLEIGDDPIRGDVVIGAMCGIGANTLVMPDNVIPEGVAIGALSYVPPRYPFKPWRVYAGNPIKMVFPRDRDRILLQAEKLRKYAESAKSAGEDIKS